MSALLQLPKVLIVDDAPINIQTLHETLQGDYQTFFATSGAEALDVIEKVQPDLVLLDIMMPEMDGYEICRRLKASPLWKDIPIIFVTALNETEYETTGLDLGAVDYITKPINPLIVRLRVRNQVELKQQRDRLACYNNELELLVKERTAKLESALHELESYCYSLSHDLRAPLRHICGFCRILEEDLSTKLTGIEADYLQRICKAAARMGELVDGLIGLPRLVNYTARRIPVDLSAKAVDVVNELAGEEPSRQVAFTAQQGVMAIGDPPLLRMVITELLGNAWKFTARTKNPVIEFGTVDLKGVKTYFVKDNGAGFDMAYVDKIFGTFQRLHHEHEFAGLGIGLAAVERIITCHGGRIWCDAKEGEGATFFFTLGEEKCEDAPGDIIHETDHN